MSYRFKFHDLPHRSVEAQAKFDEFEGNIGSAVTALEKELGRRFTVAEYAQVGWGPIDQGFYVTVPDAIGKELDIARKQ
jgi:hypothetical protein